MDTRALIGGSAFPGGEKMRYVREYMPENQGTKCVETPSEPRKGVYQDALGCLKSRNEMIALSISISISISICISISITLPKSDIARGQHRYTQVNDKKGYKVIKTPTVNSTQNGPNRK